MITHAIRKFLRTRKDVIVKEIHYEVTRSHVMAELVRRNTTCHDSIVDSRQHGLSVSLTTFGRRINDVFLAVESIGCQSLRPGKIVLWLAEDEFNDSSLPITIKNLVQRGLSVCYCKDMKQYKKLIPALSMCPDDMIITIDDDVMYGFDLVERLHSEYVRNPGVVYCGMAKTIQVERARMAPYSRWPKNTGQAAEPSLMNVPIGCGGVLYFPGCFHGDVAKDELYSAMCPYSDDLWFKAMTLLKGVRVKSIYANTSIAARLVPTEVCAADSLSMINILQNKNDEQWESVTRRYGLMDRLMNDK